MKIRILFSSFLLHFLNRRGFALHILLKNLKQLVDPNSQVTLPYTFLVEPGGKIVYGKRSDPSCKDLEDN